MDVNKYAALMMIALSFAIQLSYSRLENEDKNRKCVAKTQTDMLNNDNCENDCV